MELPDVHVGAWAPTKRTLHMCSQMLGKLRVALSPDRPNWLFTSLALNARGITTGAIPWRGTTVEASLDLLTSEMIVERSTGETRRFSLVPARTLANVHEAFTSALEALGVECAISTIPQEVPDTTPFDQDHRPAEYDPAAVQRWFAAATFAAGVFEEWRAHFFGRSSVQLWWGAFDVAVLLFNGKHVPAPTDRGYLLKYDFDAEQMNAGFYLGDENTAPFFYGYIYPQPENAESFAIAPEGAAWSPALKEWVLPYDVVRGAADPQGRLRAFLDAMYGHCCGAANWDSDALAYVAPKRKRYR